MKSIITRVMTQPLYDLEIKSVHQLFESDVPIMYFSPTQDSVFPDEPNQDPDRIAARTVSCSESLREQGNCLGEKLAHGPISLITLRTTMEVLTEKHPRGTFHVLDQSIAIFPIVSFTRKTHFLLPAFRRHIGRLVKVGLTEHWRAGFKMQPECDVPYLANWRLSDLS